ncbi:ABC transporter substrate-binding protein [Baia soyae]|uniref:Peptide/nickel transport system substrate-binding protein n=1 Tax=Baia soyae TaxID=1544746 RepID=A0A4V2SWZ6_9BACL|nr:ABC transporter substrate-binding protein [Baia soyae]TCP64246.1 peptide/nickel transport system substrate-binding protein [Baia soyae]
MKKSKIGILSLAVVMGLSVFATACGSKSSGDGAKKKSITATMNSTFDGKFNPGLYDSVYDAYILDQTFASLWKQDEKLETSIPDLAESWKESEKKDAVSIKLRKDAKWSDGKPLTVDDVIFTWKFIADKEYSGSRFEYVESIKGAKEYHEGKAKDIEGIKKVDDYNLEVTFEKSDARDISTKVFSTPMPKHIFEGKPVKTLENDPAVKKAENIVTSGPFTIKEIKAGEFVVLEKNKNFYGAAQGKPKLDQIVWKVLQEDVAIGALKEGKVDMVSRIKPSSFETIKGFKDVELVEDTDLGYQYLGFRTDHPKLSDKKVRRAIAYAINREQMVTGLLKGHGTLLSTPVSPKSWAYNKDLDADYSFDPAKAKALLAEAGYKDTNGDGFVEDPSGKPYVLSLEFPKGNQVREQSAKLIREDIEKVGIKIDLKQPKDFAALAETVQQKADKTMEMWLMGWTTDVDPNPKNIYGSTAESNYYRWKSPESDKSIGVSMYDQKAFTKEGRKALIKDWTKIFQQDSPVVLLYSQNIIDAYNKRVTGVQYDYRGALGHPSFVDWDVK